MEIKLIALDMDGTVLRSDKSVSEYTLQTFREASARGALVVPATGRIRKMLPKPVTALPFVRYAVTSNGASVIDLKENHVIYRNLISREDSFATVKLISDYHLFSETYVDGISFAEEKMFQSLNHAEIAPWLYEYLMESQIFVDDLPKHIEEINRPLEKINILFVPEKLRRTLINNLNAIAPFSLTSALDGNIEINAPTASKGDGLAFLCKTLNIRPQEVMAFGDGSNDVSMLQFAGYSFAMGNADNGIKNAAKYTAASNDDDGVARAIQTFFINQKS